MKSIASSTLLIALSGICTCACAGGPLPDGPYVIADGSASMDITPDYAVINFTISNTAPTTAAASDVVDGKADKVFALLKKAGIQDVDIRASNLNVSPDSEYDGNKRVYLGQNVERGFRITLHKLDKFSELLQGLLDTNIDELNTVDFGSSQQKDAEKKTLDLAVDNARQQAEELASRTGAHVDKVYGIAPGNDRAYISQQFPNGYSPYAQLGKIEVTGTRIKRSEGYIIPKSISVSSEVTIVCTVK